MEMKKLISTTAILGAMTFGATAASADAPALSNLNTYLTGQGISNSQSCEICHTASNGAGGNRQVFGDAFKSAGGGKPAYTVNSAVLFDGKADADGDGTDNLAELKAGTNPGVNPTATTTTTTTTDSTASSGGGGCMTDAATTPLMMLVAMLTLGFFVRRKKD